MKWFNQVFGSVFNGVCLGEPGCDGQAFGGAHPANNHSEKANTVFVFLPVSLEGISYLLIVSRPCTSWISHRGGKSSICTNVRPSGLLALGWHDRENISVLRNPRLVTPCVCMWWVVKGRT